MDFLSLWAHFISFYSAEAGTQAPCRLAMCLTAEASPQLYSMNISAVVCDNSPGTSGVPVRACFVTLLTLGFAVPLSSLSHSHNLMEFLLPIIGLMITSAAIYHVLHFLHITIDIRNVCVFLAPLFSSFTTIVTYHLTKELKVKGVGWQEAQGWGGKRMCGTSLVSNKC